MEINKVNLTITNQTEVSFDKHSDEESSLPIKMNHGYVEIFGTHEALISFVDKLYAAVHNNK
jgi:hypothetical protein